MLGILDKKRCHLYKIQFWWAPEAPLWPSKWAANNGVFLENTAAIVVAIYVEEIVVSMKKMHFSC